VGAVVLASLLMPQIAAAQQGPTITATPSTGLQDGQTVTVTGTGFDPATEDWVGTVCLTEVLDVLSSVSEINARCGLNSVVRLPTNPTGDFSTTMVVHQVQPTFTAGEMDCGQSGCLLLFLELVQDAQAFRGFAATPIRFGPPVPHARADCLSGGWRNVADDRGAPFRNQGRCVSYVVAHPH
jgi:hypothetical protein